MLPHVVTLSAERSGVEPNDTSQASGVPVVFYISVRERKGRRIGGAIDGKPFLSAECRNRFLLSRRNGVNAPYETSAGDWIVATLAVFSFYFAELQID